MKWLRFTLLMVIVAVLQSSAVMNLLSLTDMRIRPDVFLILLVYFSINCNSYDAVITSFSIGFAADIAGAVMGPHIISYGLIGTVVAYIRKIIILKKTNQQALTIFVTGLLTEFAAALLMGLKASGLAKAGAFEIFAVSAYSAILWFMIKWPVMAIGKWIGVGIFHFGARTNERQ